MARNKSNEEKFDTMLRQALLAHKEIVPDYFGPLMLQKFEDAQNKRTLTRAIVQERVALAACVLLPTVAVIVAIFFPTVIADLIDYTGRFDVVIERAVDWSNSWFYATVLAVALGLAFYYLVNSLTIEE